LLGWLALALATVGQVALYLLRIGVLDTVSLPQHALAVAAIGLAAVQLRRGGARHARIAAALAIASALAFVFALPRLAGYSDDRPRGTEVGQRFPIAAAPSALDDSVIPVAAGSPTPFTYVICFRGFW
jgi:hypothetical protein